jgi:plasmid maintenance system antidote protein VapI
MLSDDDIVRAVRSIRFASKRLRNGRRALSVNALAKHAGITRDTVYRIANTGTMSPETADKLRSVLGPTP